MFSVTRLNGTEIWVNPFLIETIECTPDSIITLTNGHKYIVQESPDVIRQRIMTFLQEIGPLGMGNWKGEIG